MVEELERLLSLRFSGDLKVFTCEIGDTKLKECIMENVEEKPLINLDDETSKTFNYEVLNCLDTMVTSCIGKDTIKDNALTSEANITMIKNRKNQWEMKKIDLKVKLKKEDELLIEKIEQCLKFFNFGCFSKDSFSFSVAYDDPSKMLKGYKNDLLDLKKNLELILGREILDKE